MLRANYKKSIEMAFKVLHLSFGSLEPLQKAGPNKIYDMLVIYDKEDKKVPDFIEALKQNKEEAVQYIAGLLGMC